ncbi:MAG: glycosyltransferase family 9 protein [Candidatus Pacearchaeota archaeon]
MKNKQYKNSVGNKILFAPQIGIGDLVFTLPLLHSLKESYKGYEVVVPIISSEQKATSFSLQPLFEGLVKFLIKPIKESFDKERYEIYREKDFVGKFLLDLDKRKQFEKRVLEYYLQGETYSFAIIPKRFRIDSIDCNKQINLDYLPYKKDLHVVERNLQFADFLKIPKKVSFRLNLLSQRRPIKLSGEEITLPENYTIIVLGAGRSTKKWNIEGNKSITKYCKTRGYAPVLIGSPKEYEESKAIEGKGVINLVSKHEFSINLENFCEIASKSKVVVGPDTGLIHLSDAVGAKVIGLYGPTRPSKFAPYNNKEFVVSTNHIDKSMDNISSKDVIRKLEMILQN